MPITSEKYKPCPDCKGRDVLGQDAGGRLICLCGANYYPEKQGKDEENG